MPVAQKKSDNFCVGVLSVIKTKNKAVSNDSTLRGSNWVLRTSAWLPDAQHTFYLNVHVNILGGILSIFEYWEISPPKNIL